MHEKSFESLALPHLEAVYRYARRLTGDEHETEDLVQETYLRAYKAFSRFELREFGVKPWLLKILHNTYLNRRVRDLKAPRATDQQTLDEVHGETDAGAGEAPELDYENLDSEVKVALERLSPEFRAIILLWSTMELSYQEISDILGVPIGTVMSRLHRARQQLMKSLADYARDRRLLAGEEYE